MTTTLERKRNRRRRQLLLVLVVCRPSRATLQAAHEAGVPLRALAAALGVDRETVCRHLNGGRR